MLMTTHTGLAGGIGDALVAIASWGMSALMCSGLLRPRSFTSKVLPAADAQLDVVIQLSAAFGSASTPGDAAGLQTDLFDALRGYTAAVHLLQPTSRALPRASIAVETTRNLLTSHQCASEAAAGVRHAALALLAALFDAGFGNDALSSDRDAAVLVTAAVAAAAESAPASDRGQSSVTSDASGCAQEPAAATAALPFHVLVAAAADTAADAAADAAACTVLCAVASWSSSCAKLVDWTAGVVPLLLRQIARAPLGAIGELPLALATSPASSRLTRISDPCAESHTLSATKGPAVAAAGNERTSTRLPQVLARVLSFMEEKELQAAAVTREGIGAIASISSALQRYAVVTTQAGAQVLVGASNADAALLAVSADACIGALSVLSSLVEGARAACAGCSGSGASHAVAPARSGGSDSAPSNADGSVAVVAPSSSSGAAGAAASARSGRRGHLDGCPAGAVDALRLGASADAFTAVLLQHGRPWLSNESTTRFLCDLPLRMQLIDSVRLLILQAKNSVRPGETSLPVPSVKSSESAPATGHGDAQAVPQPCSFSLACALCWVLQDEASAVVSRSSHDAAAKLSHLGSPEWQTAIAQVVRSIAASESHSHVGAAGKPSGHCTAGPHASEASALSVAATHGSLCYVLSGLTAASGCEDTRAAALAAGAPSLLLTIAETIPPCLSMHAIRAAATLLGLERWLAQPLESLAHAESASCLHPAALSPEHAPNLLNAIERAVTRVVTQQHTIRACSHGEVATTILGLSPAETGAAAGAAVVLDAVAAAAPAVVLAPASKPLRSGELRHVTVAASRALLGALRSGVPAAAELIATSDAALLRRLLSAAGSLREPLIGDAAVNKIVAAYAARRSMSREDAVSAEKLMTCSDDAVRTCTADFNDAVADVFLLLAAEAWPHLSPSGQAAVAATVFTDAAVAAMMRNNASEASLSFHSALCCAAPGCSAEEAAAAAGRMKRAVAELQLMPRLATCFPAVPKDDVTDGTHPALAAEVVRAALCGGDTVAALAADGSTSLRASLAGVSLIDREKPEDRKSMLALKLLAAALTSGHASHAAVASRAATFCYTAPTSNTCSINEAALQRCMMRAVARGMGRPKASSKHGVIRDVADDEARKVRREDSDDGMGYSGRRVKPKKLKLRRRRTDADSETESETPPQDGLCDRRIGAAAAAASREPSEPAKRRDAIPAGASHSAVPSHESDLSKRSWVNAPGPLVHDDVRDWTSLEAARAKEIADDSHPSRFKGSSSVTRLIFFAGRIFHSARSHTAKTDGTDGTDGTGSKSCGRRPGEPAGADDVDSELLQAAAAALPCILESTHTSAPFIWLDGYAYSNADLPRILNSLPALLLMHPSSEAICEAVLPVLAMVGKPAALARYSPFVLSDFAAAAGGVLVAHIGKPHIVCLAAQLLRSVLQTRGAADIAVLFCTDPVHGVSPLPALIAAGRAWLLNSELAGHIADIIFRIAEMTAQANGFAQVHALLLQAGAHDWLADALFAAEGDCMAAAAATAGVFPAAGSSRTAGTPSPSLLQQLLAAAGALATNGATYTRLIANGVAGSLMRLAALRAAKDAHIARDARLAMSALNWERKPAAYPAGHSMAASSAGRLHHHQAWAHAAPPFGLAEALRMIAAARASTWRRRRRAVLGRALALERGDKSEA